jgi:hypothetical protein
MPGDSDQLSLMPAGAGPVRRQRRSADLTIRALRAGGRLEPCDTLLVALVRTSADRCDELRGAEGKEFHETQALRLLFDLEDRLRGLGGPSDDAFDQLLAAAAGPTTPGHPA